MTAPLTPPDCDLRGLQFMPLDVMRLRDSDLALLSSGDEFKAAVLLWCASWLQVPAASLPDDDRRLMKLAGGVDQKTWAKIRGEALRGWTLCSDGRLYHQVVAEKALEAWDRRGDFEDKHENKTSRQQRWRERCKALSQQLRDAGVTPPAGASLTALEEMVARLPHVDGEASTGASTETSTVDGREMPLTGTGTGTVEDSDPNGSAQFEIESPPDPLADLRSLEPRMASWRLALKVLMARGGYPESRARPLVGKWQKTCAPAELWEAAEGAWTCGTLDPVSYITKALEGIKARAEGDFNPMLTPEPWRQRKWLEEFTEGQFAWDYRRGPKPDEPGCRIAPDLLREFGIEPAAPVVVAGGAA